MNLPGIDNRLFRQMSRIKIKSNARRDHLIVAALAIQLRSES